MNIPIILMCSAMLTCTSPVFPTVEASPSTVEIAVQSDDADHKEDSMITLINEARANAGLPPVQENAVLNEIAQVRLQEIMVSFSHERPDGHTKAELLEAAGVSPSNYMSENIISGTAESTPESLMKSFMASSVHRAWILSEEVNAVGVAIGRNEYNQIYAVQIFGCF
jgi:uncharacterized protein YkwD